MPIYEYVCRTCAKKFEALVMGGAAAECPSCSGRDLERLLSAFAVGQGGSSEPMPAGCGSCGDPRGPGACKLMS